MTFGDMTAGIGASLSDTQVDGMKDGQTDVQVDIITYIDIHQPST